jgi:hypothetical protein
MITKTNIVDYIDNNRVHLTVAAIATILIILTVVLKKSKSEEKNKT